MKTTELAADAAPDAGSLFMLVDDPGGSATNVKTTFSEVEATLSHDALADFVGAEHVTEAAISHDTIADVSTSDHHVQATGDITAVFDCASGDCNDVTVETGEAFEVAAGGEVEATEVVLHVNNDSGSTLFKCTAVYISGFDIPSNLPEVDIADADDDAMMPAVGLVYADIVDGADGKIITAGFKESFDTTGFTVGNDLYVNDSGTSADDTCSNTLTATRPANVGDNIQKIGTAMRVHAVSGEIEISGTNRSNDVPNLQSAYYWLGNVTNVATAVTMSSDCTMDNAGAITCDHDALDNFTVNEHYLQSAITEVGTVATGTWEGTVVDHERGGLEADVSSYDGLIKITGGTTSYVAERSGSWYQSTSVVLGTVCYLVFVVDSPNSIQESGKRVIAGENRTGNSFTITEMHVAGSMTMNNAFALYINDVGDLTSTGTAVEAIASIDLSGSPGVTVYDQTSAFDNAIIADDKWLVMDWATDIPTYIKIGLWGHW
jgi:hypothetical protein